MNLRTRVFSETGRLGNTYGATPMSDVVFLVGCTCDAKTERIHSVRTTLRVRRLISSESFSYQTADGIVPCASQTVRENLNATPLCVRLRNRVYAHLLYASVLQSNVEIEKLILRIYGTNRERPRMYHDG